MKNIRIETYQSFDLQDILARDEQLLWSGNPCYGLKIFQAVGEERLLHKCFFAGTILMWLSLFLIEPRSQETATQVFAVITVIFVLMSFFYASLRQFILGRQAYLVTNQRAILVSAGRNWRFSSSLYVVSSFHSRDYRYEIIPDHPCTSLQIGNLLSDDQVQPIGFGIHHPGIPFLKTRVYPPILFSYIDDASQVRELIQTEVHKLR